MKIVIISAVAPPEPIVSGRVHWDMAEFLAKKGNEVWIISPYPSRPLNVNYEKLKTDKLTRVSENFFHVNVNSFTYPGYNLFFRIYESYDFGVKSVRYLNKVINDYDLLYVSSWAFIGQLMILLLKKKKKIPVIMNVQDLYPESFFTKINSAIIRKILKPLCLIDKYIANKSTHLTVVSESLKQFYINKRKISDSKISVINNWQDESEFKKPIPRKEDILEKYKLENLKDKFVFMYLGNIGPVAGVEIIIGAFSKLSDVNSALIIAGSGTQRDKCRELAEELKIRNIFFVDVPPGLTPVVELQSLSDVLLLPIHPEAADSSIPSKLIAYMFSGKPVITSANRLSETAIAIKESGCGWLTETNELGEWSRLLRLAYNSEPQLLKLKGRSGLEYALENYSKMEGLKKVDQLFEEVRNK